MRWRGEVEGVLLLPLPVCLQSRFQHWNTTLLLFDRIHRLLCSCWVQKSEGVRQQDNILLVAVFLNQEFCGSFQGMYFCSVVGAQVTSWDGEGEGCSIWATDVGTTASIPDSIFCRAICEDVGPGALRIATLYHLQCECFLQFWSLCSLCCKAWNFSSDFWKALLRCPDTHCEFLAFSWICLHQDKHFLFVGPSTCA